MIPWNHRSAPAPRYTINTRQLFDSGRVSSYRVADLWKGPDTEIVIFEDDTQVHLTKATGALHVADARGDRYRYQAIVRGAIEQVKP